MNPLVALPPWTPPPPARAPASATVTHMDENVGVRELRQNLSRYLQRVKEGEAFVVTERGQEVARLTPSERYATPLAELIAERGASIPQGDLIDVLGAPGPAAVGPPSQVILDELRADRL
jgi:prevent-host-death family protein